MPTYIVHELVFSRGGTPVSRGQSREQLVNWSRGDKVEKSLPQRVRNKTKKKVKWINTLKNLYTTKQKPLRNTIQVI